MGFPCIEKSHRFYICLPISATRASPVWYSTLRGYQCIGVYKLDVFRVGRMVILGPPDFVTQIWHIRFALSELYW